MDKVFRIIGALVVVGLVLSAVYMVADIAGKSSPSPVPAAGGGEPVYFFYGDYCSHCHAVMPFIKNLSEKYPEANIQMIEISQNRTNQETYNSAFRRLNRAPTGVPVVVIGETVLVGSHDIPQNLEALIRKRLQR
jgi:thiol-disulfide isomerase/thioredoxin